MLSTVISCCTLESLAAPVEGFGRILLHDKVKSSAAKAQKVNMIQKLAKSSSSCQQFLQTHARHRTSQ